MANLERRRKALTGSASILPAVRTHAGKIAKLEAGRRVSAHKRAAAGPATTQAQLAARRAATKKGPASPLTASEKAAALRESVQPSIMRRLSDALLGRKE